MNPSTGILTIDLSAIQSNWRLVFSRLKAGAECAAVVKADAYGVGAVPVAKALYATGCSNFFVVTLIEAISLRHALPDDAAIFVLGGVPSSTELQFVENRLVPVLFSLETLAHWAKFAEQYPEPLNCVFEFDTGMSRLGIGYDELDALESLLDRYPCCVPQILMSHLACADELDHPLNVLQLERFEALTLRLKHRFPNARLSLANSSGTFLGDDFQFDMVRIGAALYGINPQMSQINPLQSVITLKLPVLQIRCASSDSSVGYGATASVPAGACLAVVAGGYSDGLHRILGGQPAGQVEGCDIKALGRMSMDSCIFDISAADNKHPEFIEVINERLTLDHLIATNRALGYEVLTSLGRRFKRVYHLDDRQ